MRIAAIAVVMNCWFSAIAGEFTIRLSARDHAGEMVVMSRYDDLITLRTVRLAEGPIGDTTILRGEVDGTQKIQLRIGNLAGDLFVRPGSDLNILFPPAAPGTPRSLGTTTRVELQFTGISPFDINALISDLNERIDAFVAEDLATDEAAGMQALDVVRRSEQPADTSERPPTLFVTPMLSRAKVDSFMQKLDRFYAEVDDPWFKGYLRYSVGGLLQGPRANDRELFDRYLKDQPVRHDDPEYIRFVRTFFEGELEMLARRNEKAFNEAMSRQDADSIHALLAQNDLLKDAQLRELVLIEQLYENYHAKFLDQQSALEQLEHVKVGSAFGMHRQIATNMIWDLTAMRAGSALPPMLLQDMKGDPAQIPELTEGPLVIAVTASWCTYCEQEIRALEHLAEEYDGIIPIVAIGLDREFEDLKKYVSSRPRKIRWLHAQAEQKLREDLRIRALPAFFVLQDGKLTHSPAPLPSAGMAEIFHRAKVQREKDQRIKVWDD